MKITVLATLMVFPAYFLVLYRGVGFIQNKRLFASAPKENLDAIPDEKERFPGAHIIGWVIELIAILLFLSAAALSVWDGGRNGFGFLKFSARFLIVLYAMEIYDITAASENLFALVTLRKLSEALMERIHGSCRFSVGFKSDADRIGRDGAAAAHHFGTAAQWIHAWDQPEKYDRPAGQKEHTRK